MDIKNMVGKYKTVLIAGGLVGVLAISYCIGQFIVLPARNSSEAAGENVAIGEGGKADLTEGISEIENFKIEWINQNETAENPWGVTADIIDTEEGNRAIFLMPDTGVRIQYHVNEEDTLEIKYYVHPWVADSSDGLQFSVRVNGNETEEISIEPQDVGDTFVYKLDISQYHNSDVEIVLEHSLRDGADLSGDWLVLEADENL